MNLVIAGVLEVLSLIKKNKKWVYFIFLFFLWLILCGKDITWDRVMYRIYYDSPYVMRDNGLEIGFQFFVMAARNLHLPFYGFLMVYSFAAFLLMSYAIMKLSKNPALVLCLYFLYPFILDAEQLRSFMGMAIITFGVSFLMEHSLKGTIVYVISCLIAALFQVSCCAFILFAFTNLPKKFIRNVIVIACVIGFLFYRNIIVLFRHLPFIVQDKTEAYLSGINEEKGIFSIIYFLVILLLMMLLIKKQEKMELTDLIRKFNLTVYKIDMISLIFLPLIYINDNFTRLPRAILLLNYIVVSNSIKSKITKRYELFILVIALSLTGIRFLSYIMGQGWEVYIVPFFFEGFHFSIN